MQLYEFFKENPRVALAFSGGVDSSYLLYAAQRCGAQVRAYYVRTDFQPEFELRDAERVAHDLNADMRLLTLDILADDTVRSNPPDRCYFCKRRLFSAIAEAAARDGFPVLIDGTNASDSAADRPGMRALREMAVRSPLRECGLTKDDIRRLSREAGLRTWWKPAYACLATRIPAGTPLTQEALARTEWAEDALGEMGFSDFRVRTLGDAAKLELRAEDFPRLLEKREQVNALLRTNYSAVLLDLEERK